MEEFVALVECIAVVGKPVPTVDGELAPVVDVGRSVATADIVDAAAVGLL